MKMTNNTNLFAPIATASENLFGSDEIKNASVFSISEIDEPQQKLVLGRQVIGHEDVGDTLCAMLLASFKSLIASHAEKNANLINKPFADKVWNISDKVSLRGTAEYYDSENDEVIVLKSCKIYGYNDNASGKSNDFYNIAYMNALMARHLGFAPKRMRLVALILDHSAVDALTKEDYPKHAISEMVWDVPEADEVAEKALLDNYVSKLETVKACVEEGFEVAPCTDEERYAKTSYALKKPANKTATKSGDYDKIAEAYKALKDEDKAKYVILKTSKFSKNCFCYCPFAYACPQHQAFLANGGTTEDVVEDVTAEFTANL